MEMVKICNGGVTMSVPEAEVDFYIRAGYERVKEKPERVDKAAKAPEKEEQVEV